MARLPAKTAQPAAAAKAAAAAKVSAAAKPAAAAGPAAGDAAPGRSPKGRATRAALLAGARRVMARDGYRNARIVDIAHEAGRSVGVFYSYFTDKGEVFAALVDEFYDDLKQLTPAPDEYEHDTGPALKAAIKGFWNAYRTYRSELAGLFEAAFTEPELLEVWKNIRKPGLRRFAYRIRRQQEQGRCRGVDPELAASALLGMLEFTCFNWQSGKLDYAGQTVADVQAVETIYRLIAQALELEPAENSAVKRAARPRSSR